MAGARYILLVEDNPDEEALALQALSANGLTDKVVVAHDGMEALDYLFGAGSHHGRDTTQKPAAILLDLQLPRIDGFEVLRRVRAHGQTSLLPVVVVTASHDVDDIREAYRLGANSYVVKPVDFGRFSSVMAQIGRYWLSLNEPADTSTRR
ncbi:response regulator [Aromatoleum diolicum]|uniref:Response regulator n=1 Tax=Aromatoleum diolicum TaxID=75796 RepID=A0ABX1Q6F9_9RHOO|nr:response regulator [Aromatoleum diolicum]NMG73954.1 response regulator [Aromatoleum diolicum]